MANLYLDPELLEEVDDYRFKHRHAARQGAIRELLRKGLDAK